MSRKEAGAQALWQNRSLRASHGLRKIRRQTSETRLMNADILLRPFTFAREHSTLLARPGPLTASTFLPLVTSVRSLLLLRME